MTRATARSADTICTLWTLGDTNEYGESVGNGIEYAVKAQVRVNPSINKVFSNSQGQTYTPKTIFVYELKDVDGVDILPPTTDTYIVIGDYRGIDKPSLGVNKIVTFDAPSTGVLRGQTPDIMAVV